MVDHSDENVLKFTDGEEGSMSFITHDKKVVLRKSFIR